MHRGLVYIMAAMLIVVVWVADSYRTTYGKVELVSYTIAFEGGTDQATGVLALPLGRFESLCAATERTCVLEPAHSDEATRFLRDHFGYEPTGANACAPRVRSLSLRIE